MILGFLQLTSIALLSLVFGVFWGPWLALSRSMATFEPAVFLPIVTRMYKNLAGVMTVLMPLTLASVIAVIIFSRGTDFVLALASLVAFIVSIIVTMAIEVPQVKTIVAWTAETLPADWQEPRDRWVAFHPMRLIAGFVALVLLLVAAIF